MRKSFFTLGVGIAVWSAATLSGAAAPAKLTGHVPAAAARLQAKGQLPADVTLNLAIGLPLRDRDGLDRLIQDVSDPSSPNFHHYLTPDQFTERFGPTVEDYHKVLQFARANGLTVTGMHPNRLIVDVSGKASDIEKTFHIGLKTYAHPREKRDFFAPDTDPTVDADLPIAHISGLDNYYIPHPKSKLLSKAEAAAAPKAGSGPFGAYRGQDFRNAYVPGTALTGTGQTVGLLQFDGFFSSDISAYASSIGLTSNVPQIVTVPIDGGVPTPDPNSQGVGEVSLDIEMILSMSPGVSTIYVYEAPNPSPWVDLLSRMANDNLSKQLSCSWGGGPPDATAEQIFQQMAAQGQSFFNATGDSDAFTGSIEFPSDSPHITQVGGTMLTSGAGAAYGSETVWNRFNGQGSSGGISTFYSIPYWQTNINFAASHASSVFRNAPDVALTAENVWVDYGSGQQGAFGGTSCAAPLWAGFMALVNQQAVANGHATMGFINPTIYSIAQTAAYTNDFHDTVTGNNTSPQSPNLFFATNNYDLCTGLGTPNGTNLINAFVNVTSTHISPPQPPYGTNLSLFNGSNPNGTWALFVQDDAALDNGTNYGGWILSLTTANPVGFAADNEISMSSSATSSVVSVQFSYDIGVTNYGPSASSNVFVIDTLPPQVALVSSNKTQGAVSRSGSSVTWTVGTLATNAGAHLSLIVQSLSSSSPVINTASVNAGTTDPNPDNDTVSVGLNIAAITPAQFGATFNNTNHAIQFSVNSLSIETNVIQASTNLINWVPIYTNVGSFIFTDPSATNYPTRYYRDVMFP